MYGINSILYQRGIYPPETFTRVQKYGLTLLVTTDEALKAYLGEVLGQVKGQNHYLSVAIEPEYFVHQCANLRVENLASKNWI